MGLEWHPIYEMEHKSHVWNHQPAGITVLAVDPFFHQQTS
jgi:hypothetical protein